jgi:hypothetical protein
MFTTRRGRPLEQRTHCLDERPRVNDFNVEGAADVCDVDVERRTGVSVRHRARVVDEHVEVTVLGSDVLGDAREVVGVGKVEPEPLGAVALTAERRRLLLGLGAVLGGDDDVVALIGERAGDGNSQADWAAAAGHECDLDS